MNSNRERGAYLDEQRSAFVDLLDDVLGEDALANDERRLFHDLESLGLGDELIDRLGVVQLLVVLLLLCNDRNGGWKGADRVCIVPRRRG